MNGVSENEDEIAARVIETDAKDSMTGWTGMMIDAATLAPPPYPERALRPAQHATPHNQY